MVTFENYEEYMMLYADGELPEAAIRELLTFVALHPELQAELNAYMSTQLQPEMDMVFADKESLLRPAPAKKTIALGWMKYGVAAGLILLVGIGVYNWNNTHETSDVTITVAKPKVNATTQPIAAKATINQMDTVNSRPATLVPQKGVNHKKQDTRKPAEELGRTHRTQERSNIALLQPVSNEGFAVNIQPYTSDIYAVADPIYIDIKEPKKKHHIPVADESKESMYVLGEAISERVQDVKNLTANIKTNGVGFNIGGKEIKVNF